VVKKAAVKPAAAPAALPAVTATEENRPATA